MEVIIVINNIGLIDLNSKVQFFELVHSDSNNEYERYTTRFLHNGDLILVSSYDLKIYKYLTKDMSKNTATLKYSEIYDIEIPKSLYNKFICSSIYLEKLFLFIQNLQYSSRSRYEFATVIMNKNHTLLAVEILYCTYIFSIEIGRLISKFCIDPSNTLKEFIISTSSTLLEFVTLKNDFEGLIVYNPYQHGTKELENNNFNNSSVITKLNRKFFINNINNDKYICITKGLDKNKFQQISHKITYHNNIYDSSTFKEIQNFLKEIVEKEKINR
ncbi:46546_t:CDS:2, partial [Gigaspora margarita]